MGDGTIGRMSAEKAAQRRTELQSRLAATTAMRAGLIEGFRDGWITVEAARMLVVTIRAARAASFEVATIDHAAPQEIAPGHESGPVLEALRGMAAALGDDLYTDAAGAASAQLRDAVIRYARSCAGTTAS